MASVPCRLGVPVNDHLVNVLVSVADLRLGFYMDEVLLHKLRHYAWQILKSPYLLIMGLTEPWYYFVPLFH